MQVSVFPNFTFSFGPKEPDGSKQKTAGIHGDDDVTVFFKHSFDFCKNMFRVHYVFESFSADYNIKEPIFEWYFVGVSYNKGNMRIFFSGEQNDFFIGIKASNMAFWQNFCYLCR